jgi:hypothetical protein
MRTTIFQTPDLIDVRSFTMMGINAKPNTDNPIGRFGTGLKYAIAVLVRLGVEPVLYIGRDKYTFSRKRMDFRGKDFEGIRLKREGFNLLRPTYTELPYTTEYGKDWKLWMVMRELEANTRDEGGNSFTVNGPVAGYSSTPDTTLLVIESDDFAKQHDNMSEVFLSPTHELYFENDDLQVFYGQSKHMYFRGLRVADLKKPTVFTYNFKRHVDLTEDRTVKYDFQLQEAFAKSVVVSKDERFIDMVLTADSEHWERSIPYDASYFSLPPPSEEFKAVLARRRSAVTGYARGYYGSYAPSKTYSPVTLFEKYPKPWTIVDDCQIASSSGVAIFEKPYYSSPGWDDDWLELAQAVIDRVNGQEEDDPEAPDHVDEDTTQVPVSDLNEPDIQY